MIPNHPFNPPPDPLAEDPPAYYRRTIDQVTDRLLSPAFHLDFRAVAPNPRRLHIWENDIIIGRIARPPMPAPHAF
jgi:hypothetical protein